MRLLTVTNRWKSQICCCLDTQKNHTKYLHKSSQNLTDLKQQFILNIDEVVGGRWFTPKWQTTQQPSLTWPAYNQLATSWVNLQTNCAHQCRPSVATNLSAFINPSVNMQNLVNLSELFQLRLRFFLVTKTSPSHFHSGDQVTGFHQHDAACAQTDFVGIFWMHVVLWDLLLRTCS